MLFDIFLSSAVAQEAANVAADAATKAPAQSPLMSFVPFILIFFVFYFLMIRPQKKKLAEEQNFLNNLQKGDEIYTKSGLIGVVTGVTEKLVTLEVSEGVKIKVLKMQIGGLFKKLLEQAAEKKPQPAKK